MGNVLFRMSARGGRTCRHIPAADRPCDTARLRKAESVLLADAVVAFVMAGQVSCIRWVDVRDVLAVAPVLVDESRLHDGDEEVE